MYRTISFPLTLVCLLPLLAAAAPIQDLLPSKIYDQTVRGTALVQTADGRGSGWLASRSGLLVTNHHVVTTHEAVEVAFPEFQKGELIAEKSHYRKNAELVRGQVLYTDP